MDCRQLTKISIVAGIIIFGLMVALGSMSNPEEYNKQLQPDKEMKVVSVKQIKIDTVFMHYYNIRVGFIDKNKIQFKDFSIDSENIVYSNNTTLIQKNTRLWGAPYDYILYWNGTEF